MDQASSQNQDSTGRPAAGDRLWRFFSSVKLTFALLLILAGVSILGTIIPQKEHPQSYLRAYGPGAGSAVLTLKLNDIYHSPWFRLLMGLLAANLVICSLNRWPQAYKAMRRDPAKDLARRLRVAHSFTVKSSPPEVSAAAQGLLAKQVGKVHQQNQAEKVVLMAQRGAWTRLGVYGVHLSVLVIFIGAMVGNFLGFEGMITLPEGGSTTALTMERGTLRPLGFGIRLDRFTLSRYPNGQISEYRSDVTFTSPGQEPRRVSIIVNDPATYGGLTFYQSTYNQAKRLRAKVTYQGKTNAVELPSKQWVDVGGGVKARLEVLRENIRLGPVYQGPAAALRVQLPGKPPGVAYAFKEGAALATTGPMQIGILAGAEAVVGSRQSARLRFNLPTGPKELLMRVGQVVDLGSGLKAQLVSLRTVKMGQMYSGPVARLSFTMPGGRTSSLVAFKTGSRISRGGKAQVEILGLVKAAAKSAGLKVAFNLQGQKKEALLKPGVLTKVSDKLSLLLAGLRTMDTPAYRGPVAQIEVHRAGQKKSEVLAYRQGAVLGGKGPLKIAISGFKSVWISGLSVSYDPGVPLVWIGCIMMLLGFLVVFYGSHRKVWLRLTPSGKNRSRVEIAGVSNKNQAALSRRLETIAALGRQQLGGEA